jgi:hypothetical protein
MQKWCNWSTRTRSMSSICRRDRTGGVVLEHLSVAALGRSFLAAASAMWFFLRMAPIFARRAAHERPVKMRQGARL